MEEYISNLAKSLGFFCNHLENSCNALKQSIDRRPIPLDSASSTFIQGLNRRVKSASSDLNLLESMSFGTVSFEELLGHCNEVYKNNQSHVLELQDRLKAFNYVPELEIKDEDENSSPSTPLASTTKEGLDASSPVSVTRSMLKSLEEDPLLDESLSLKKLGLSDVCLATLASEDDRKIDNTNTCSQEQRKYSSVEVQDLQVQPENPANVKGEGEDDPKAVHDSRPIVEVSKDDYESLPSYMKGLVSWEDLLMAVGKINSGLRRKEKSKGHYYFLQDEIASLELGPKAKCYLLLLTRLKRFAVGTVDGLVSYQVL